MAGPSIGRGNSSHLWGFPLRLLLGTAVVMATIASAAEDVRSADVVVAQVNRERVSSEGSGEEREGQKPSKDGNARLEMVVVTAQKREESLQEVPIAVQVISSEVLAEQNHNTLEEMSQTIPGVVIKLGGTSNDLYIRGIGSTGNQSFDQSVGLFSDDIFHGRSRLSSATFFDLDRVELLKGPQSTFFGNNAIAGAVNIVTKKPGETFDASARALYGEFGQYALEGAAGGPITDTLGVRIAVTGNGQKGWIDNVTTGRREPHDNNLAGRVTLAFKPTSDLDAALKIEGSKNREIGVFPQQWVNCPPAPPVSGNYGYPPGGGCSDVLKQGVQTGLSSNKTYGPAGFFNLSTGEEVLTMHYQKWGQTFTSVTGFYNYHADLSASPFPDPQPVLTTELPEKFHQFSQEFRIASATGQIVEYLVGAYLQTDRGDWHQGVTYPFLNRFITSGPLFPYLPLGTGGTSSHGEHIDSVFGSLSWNVTDSLKVSGGLRGSWIKKDYVQTSFTGTGSLSGDVVAPLPAAVAPGSPFGPPSTLGGGRSDQAWMPSANVTYRVAPEATAYVSYSRGFKSGGFQQPSLTANPPVSGGFEPEYVNDYELGLKSEWVNNTVLLNLDVFRMDYRDLQVQSYLLDPATNSFTGAIRNAAKSRSQGVEVEGQWVASQNFRLSVNVACLDSRYGSYVGATVTALQYVQGIRVQDLTGSPTLFAPRWAGSLSAAYTARLPGDYELITELAPYYSSSYFFHDPSNDPFFRQGGYLRLDARLSFKKVDSRWAVDLIGKNLGDRDIAADAGSYFTVSKQQPRNVALQARYKW